MSSSRWEEIVKRVPRTGDTHDGLIAHLYERVEELEEQLADVQKLLVRHNDLIGDSDELR